jgi:hypothetical protein
VSRGSKRARKRTEPVADRLLGLDRTPKRHTVTFDAELVQAGSRYELTSKLHVLARERGYSVTPTETGYRLDSQRGHKYTPPPILIEIEPEPEDITRIRPSRLRDHVLVWTAARPEPTSLALPIALALADRCAATGRSTQADELRRWARSGQVFNVSFSKGTGSIYVWRHGPGTCERVTAEEADVLADAHELDGDRAIAQSLRSKAAMARVWAERLRVELAADFPWSAA